MLTLIVLLGSFTFAREAACPVDDDLREMRVWCAAKFPGAPATPEAALTVLSNNDCVQKMGRLGRPLVMGGREYRRGLFVHAVSAINVRLPAPGATFEALAGVDTNEYTSGGKGSVVFTVTVDNAERFRSGRLVEGLPPVPVRVDLAGAREFSIAVGDAGDGNGCDQADWADARVTLADNSVLYLADMAMDDPHWPAPMRELPFEFTYGGKSSRELCASWKLTETVRALDAARTERTLAWTDSETGLAVRCVAVTYADYPVVEWTLHFKNPGTSPTPLLENIRALDAAWENYRWPQPDIGEFLLHHFAGTPCTARDFEPRTTRLSPGTTTRIAAEGGRPTNSDLCYFNVELASRGVIVAVGWPGQWAGEFARDKERTLRIRIGQELTRFTLLPGEEVRSPLIALLFWQGDWLRGQNIWRRWMLSHNVPRPGGALPPSPQLAACSSHQFGEMINANEENQKFFIDRYLEEGIALRYWWMDAGWYVNSSGWPNTGTWEVDTQRFPRGLRAITDHAHEKGVKSIVWFEPERVTPGTWLYTNHAAWLLGRDGETKLLDLGNIEARQWLVDHIDGLIRSQGIDLFRSDYNIDPLGFWRAADAPDRQGIREIKYVEGYLAYWDELRRRHGDMLIDSCASGGRRNDLETLRRAVPLLRSDYIIEPVGNQGHTYGASFWIPFSGTGTSAYDKYGFRSVMCPHFTACWDMRRKELDYDAIRARVAEWTKIAPCFLGDYYPLTNWSLALDAWIGWQFNRPETGDGVVQVFRRADSIYEAARLRLRGLDENARYIITDLDAPEKPTTLTGDELMQRGIPVTVTERPAAVLLSYAKAETGK